MILLLKLLLAHLAGDFLLQPDSWVSIKETKKLKAYQLYLHAFIHFVLIMLLVWDITFWKWALMIAVFHFISDVVKLFAQHETPVKIKRPVYFERSSWNTQNKKGSLVSQVNPNGLILITNLLYIFYL